MDSKWPFMLIIFGLLFALGFVISQLERTGVIKNWDKRRCEFPVMAAGAFFKPKTDPRSATEFASDNFQFCMKGYVEKFIELALAPFQAIFSKHSGVAGNALGLLSTIRNIASTMYNALLGFLDTYFRKFIFSVYEMSRIVQFLRMAMRRANALMINFLYTGLTMFRGMLNTIQFVIKVIMVICGILLALIIILIFVLFPMIPMILAVLGAIIATVLSLVMVVGGEVDQAISDKHGFCFSEETKILVKNPDNSEIFIPITSVKLGQELGANCGKISAVIKMDGKDVSLYNLEGIFVSGSHLVKGTDNIWKSVEKDERAIISDKTSKILYSFNTTTNQIPIYTPKCEIKNKEKYIIFRDWEEISDNDKKGQLLWDYYILKHLNKSSNYNIWNSSIKLSEHIPIISKNTHVKTNNGFIEIKKLNISDIILDSRGNTQKVLGIIEGLLEGVNDTDDIWNTGLYEYNGYYWIKGESTIHSGNKTIIGKTIITESGEFIILDENGKEKLVRDFTDIGHKTIHETYPFVSERLRFE